MKKSKEELQKEYDENTVKLEQYRHKGQQLENRIRYYMDGDRKKRTHRLITRGAAIESVVPDVRSLAERDFYLLIEQIFSLPEVNALMVQAIQKDEGS